MKLNREGVQLSAEERNKRNKNWEIIENESTDVLKRVTELNETTNKRVDGIVIEAGTEAFNQVVSSAAIEWKEPVTMFADLAVAYSQAKEGWTSQTAVDGVVYRYDGSEWKKIQQVDAGPVNALDTRLTAQMTENTTEIVKRGNGLEVYNLEAMPKNIDVSDFITTKIAEGVRKFIIPEGLVLNKTLEIKNYKNKSLVFTGASSDDIDAPNPNFWLNTGGVGIKTVNSHSVKFENLTLSSMGQINPSTIGILLTREDASATVPGSGHTHVFDNVSIRLQDNLSLHSGRGTIGLYSNTVEVCEFRNIKIRSNTPAIFTKSDILKLQPTNTYKTSMKDIAFTGTCIMTSMGGSGVVFDGIVNASGMISAANLKNDDNYNIGGVELMGFNSGINITFDSELFRVGMIVNGRVEKSNLYLNVLRPKYGIKIGQTENSIVDTGYKKGQLLTTELRLVVSWHSSEIERYDIYNTADSQGIATLLSLGNLKIKNDSVISGLVIVGEQPTIVNSPTATSQYVTLSAISIGIAGKELAFNYGDPTYSLPSLSKGSVVFNTNITGNEGAPQGYIKIDETSYTAFGQNGYRKIYVGGVPTATPKQKGELIFDENNNAWIAYGVGVGEFKKMTT